MTEGTPVEWFEESARRCREIYDWVQPGDELGQDSTMRAPRSRSISSCCRGIGWPRCSTHCSTGRLQ